MNLPCPRAPSLSTQHTIQGKMLINRPTIPFVAKQSYEQAHIDGIMDYNGQCLIKQFVTKLVGRGFQLQVCVIDISEVEQGHNDGGDDAYTNGDGKEATNDNDFDVNCRLPIIQRFEEARRIMEI